MARMTSAVVTPEIRAAAADHKNPTMAKGQNSAQIEVQNSGQFSRKLMSFLFYFQWFAVLALALALTIRGFLSHHARHRFRPLDWYPPVLSSVGLAGINGLVLLAVTHCQPSKAIKLAFWFCPLLTVGMGILLILTDSAFGVAFGVISIIVGIGQSLYACWASQRFDHAIAVLKVCTAFPPTGTTAITALAEVLAVVYACILMGGVGGATAAGTQLDKALVAVMVISMLWTMQVIKNILQVAISGVKYLQFSSGADSLSTWTSLRAAILHSMGPISIGSILVPVVSFIRGSARAITLIGGDSDEFLFSCADCYYGIASALIKRANRWAFVHVGVYTKGIVQSSMDTWEMFIRARMEQLIDLDLTSSFCFFCALGGGSLSSLLGGSWALIVHKEYAPEVAAYGFLIGYFLTWIALAGPQACVSAYHVAYAENPENARFDATIPVRLQELQRHQV